MAEMGAMAEVAAEKLRRPLSGVKYVLYFLSLE
jgi:hypothetical protein